MSARYVSEIRLDGELPRDSYLCRLPVIRYLAEQGGLRLSADVTFFVGENGTGKSTLLEGIATAWGFNPEGGSRNFTFSTKDTHSELGQHLTLARRAHPRDGYFLRAESFYNVATSIDALKVVGSYGGVSLHEKSHGESFLTLVQQRFGGHGLYLLDEPEAALSPMRQLTLLVELQRLVEQESQLVIATHSPILMAFPGAEIFEFSEQGIVRRDYRETEHYQVTRTFLENPERMLRYLLEDAGEEPR
jgi:predicted ATPase